MTLVIGLSWLLVAGNCVPNEQRILYPHPDETYLDVTGTIDRDLSYIMSVAYVQDASTTECATFEEASGRCHTRPQRFTYVPRIEQTTHALRVPLTALAPKGDSPWHPEAISICVGPRIEHSVPHQCRPLFLITQDHHDGNQTITLRCSPDWWCGTGHHVERVSTLNHTYVVNIMRASAL